MNKVLKTYAIYGMIEWTCQILNGKTRLTIPFTGGAITGFGITPALYSTDNPVVQAIIERSAYYTSGKIKLHRQVDQGVEDSRYVGNGTKSSTHGEDGLNEAAGANVIDGEDKSNMSNKSNIPTITSSEELKENLVEISVTDLGDAKNYLVEHYGVSRSSLKGEASILEQAKLHGIVFVGL